MANASRWQRLLFGAFFLTCFALDPWGLTPDLVKLPLLLLGLAGAAGLSTLASKSSEDSLDQVVGAWVLWAWLGQGLSSPGGRPGFGLFLPLGLGLGFLLGRRIRPEQVSGGLRGIFLGLVGFAVFEVWVSPTWVSRLDTGGLGLELVGPTGNPNWTASLVLLCLPSLALGRRAWAWMGLGIGLLAASLSRGAFLALLIQGAAGLWAGRRAEGDGGTEAKDQGLRSGSGALGAALSLLILGGILAPRLDWQGLTSTKTLETRLELWRASLPLIGEHPVFGTGLGGLGRELQPKLNALARPDLFSIRFESTHSFALDLFLGLGLGGAVLLLLVQRESSAIPREASPARTRLLLGWLGAAVAECFSTGWMRPFLATLSALVLGSWVGPGEPPAARREAQGRGPSTLAWMAGAAALAFLGTLSWPIQERLRNRLQSAGRARRPLPPEELDLPDSGRLELRMDCASLLAIQGRWVESTARFLWIEAEDPWYPGALSNRQAIHHLGKLPRPTQGDP